MNRIILDRAVLDKFGDLKAGAELCDDSGRVVGFFTPACDRPSYAGVEAPVSRDELWRRARQAGGRALQEILADLESRT
jgi:hypothetical protein